MNIVQSPFLGSSILKRWIYWFRFLPFSAAWAAVLVGSLLAFLNFHEYPLGRSEVVSLALSLVVVAAFLGPIHANAARLMPIMDAALVYIALDLNFDPPYPWIGAAVVVLASWLARRSIAPVVGIIFMFVAGGQVLSGAQASDAPDKLAELSAATTADRPAIVHIVLDEHIGIEGIDTRDFVMRRAADGLRTEYLDMGFTLYGGAHARHFYTTNSLPEILNFGESELGGDSRRNLEKRIDENQYFDEVSDQGYDVEVWQSDFLDYCDHEAVASCEVYRRSDLAPLARLNISDADKIRILGSSFVSLSGGLTALSRLYDYLAVKANGAGLALPYANIDSVRLTSTLAAMKSARDFKQRLRSVKPGHLYFAHFLFPHYPYIANKDCSIRPLSGWRYRRDRGDMRSRNHAYVLQAQCAARMVRGFLKALSESSAGRNAVVIMHGDHGSRITRDDPKIRNIGRISRRDMIAGYSTLFGIRIPGSPARYEPRMAATSGLLKQFVERDLRSVPDVSRGIAGTNSVYLADDEWRPVRTYPLKNPRSSL